MMNFKVLEKQEQPKFRVDTKARNYTDQNKSIKWRLKRNIESMYRGVVFLWKNKQNRQVFSHPTKMKTKTKGKCKKRMLKD